MNRSRARAFFAFMLVVTACAGGGTGNGASPRRAGLSLSGEDRIVIPAMTVIRGVASSDRYLFVASAGGLGVYDRQFSEWRAPLTRVDGWPEFPVTVMMIDPADPSAVWFAAENIVYHYRVGFNSLVRAVVPERVSPGLFYVDAADPGAGVIVGGSATLTRVSPTGFAQPYVATSPLPRPGQSRARIVPQTVASVYAQYRSLQDFERMLTRDDALRSWQVSAAAVTPTRSEVWLGTAGGGVFKVDPVFGRGEQFPYGLISEGASAVAAVGDGIWFGSIGGGVTQRGGLTFTETDMRRWRWVDGGAASPFGTAVITGISPWESELWVASDHGLFRVDAASGSVLRRWDEGNGLPSAQALAVAATPAGAWVGTARGLAFVHDAETPTAGARASDVEQTMLTGSTIRALVRRGDTLWIGSDGGLLALPPGGTQPRRLRNAPADNRLSQPVTAIATADSIIAFATAGGDVLRVHTRTGELLDTLSYINTQQAGRIYALAMDASTLWAAGERGLMIIRRDSRLARFVSAGNDIPGEVFGVALTKDYAWLATRYGAVRIRRLADGTAR